MGFDGIPIPAAAKLQSREPGIKPSLRNQFIMLSPGHHAPLFHHDDAVDPVHRREPLCDDDRRVPLHEMFQGILHQPFAFRLQGAGGYVQQQGGIAQDLTRYSDALLLFTRQPHATFSLGSGEFIRQSK
jgi:hypothetical protein